MAVNFDVPTRPSMFIHLRDGENDAWSTFVSEYGPMIASWCLRYGLTEAETADVTQNVLIKLVQVMRQSRYDPKQGSFRGWLKTVTNNAVKDVMRTWDKPGKGTGDTVVHAKLSLMEDPKSMDALNDCIDQEYKNIVLNEAKRRVRERVKDFTWRAYEMTAIQQKTPQEASAELGLKVGEVYVAKSRVIKMLREEIQKHEENQVEGHQEPDQP
ncbi:RNA polymerase sigma factor [Roseiconus lacunae]|uniref:RNA polymerase sigma factor n=1 Tax=Roseiconus lacunae TaxID=2605694 RepID=UPI001E65452A|nr:sigma-70 family RNA polymerase sigma factor [Roseiconus lacunae]MCD0457893.1 sigma-70 family RNA polymerase sigma factor [Roseiconus lacunae]